MLLLKNGSTLPLEGHLSVLIWCGPRGLLQPQLYPLSSPYTKAPARLHDSQFSAPGSPSPPGLCTSPSPGSDVSSRKPSLNSHPSENMLEIPPVCFHIPLFLPQSETCHTVFLLSLYLFPPSDGALLRPGNMLHSLLYPQHLTRDMP